MPPDSPSDDGRSLFRRRHGTGDRIYVGLHGWNGTHRTFDPLIPHLPSDATLVAVDLPGYGDSPEPEAWSLEAIAAELVRTLDEVGIDEFSLVGNCSGAVVGLFVAQTAGDRLRRFYLLEPFSHVPWYLRLLLTPVAGRVFYTSAFGTNLGRRLTNRLLADKRDQEVDLMAAFANSDLDVPYRYLELFDRIESPEKFADLPGKKILVHSEYTFAAVEQSLDDWRAVWPDSRLMPISGAGHLLIEEDPARVAERLFEP